MMLFTSYYTPTCSIGLKLFFIFGGLLKNTILAVRTRKKQGGTSIISSFLLLVVVVLDRATFVVSLVGGDVIAEASRMTIFLF